MMLFEHSFKCLDISGALLFIYGNTKQRLKLILHKTLLLRKTQSNQSSIYLLFALHMFCKDTFEIIRKVSMKHVYGVGQPSPGIKFSMNRIKFGIQLR